MAPEEFGFPCCGAEGPGLMTVPGALARDVHSWVAKQRVRGQESALTTARLALVRGARPAMGSGPASPGAGGAGVPRLPHMSSVFCPAPS